MKYQVVTSLGQRDAAPALLRIAQSEQDRRLRDVAIVTLGEAGGRQQLAMLYLSAAADAETAHYHRSLQRARRGRAHSDRRAGAQPPVRAEVLGRLLLLGTPKAMSYLEKHR